MDRRARHPGVFAAVAAAVPVLAAAGSPVRVVEFGGGSGGGFRHWMRLLAPAGRGRLTVVDQNPRLLAAYRERARGWGAARGMEAVRSGRERLLLRSPERALALRFVAARISEGLAEDLAEGPAEGMGTAPGSPFELAVAQSFWDLLRPGAAVPLARGLLRPGGVFYATLTFAGKTVFSPPHADDRRVAEAYHASMANPRAGPGLASEFAAEGSGFEVLASGRSDWRVEPDRGGYAADEAFFLRTILGFFEKELSRRDGGLDDHARAWLDARRRQLHRGELRFTASQMDLAAERHPA